MFLFSFTAEKKTLMCTVFLFHPSIGGHLGWLCFLAMVTRTVVNMDVPIPLQWQAGKLRRGREPGGWAEPGDRGR